MDIEASFRLTEPKWICNFVVFQKVSNYYCLVIIIIIIFCLENIAFFHAKLRSDVCPRVDNQTSGDTLLCKASYSKVAVNCLLPNCELPPYKLLTPPKLWIASNKLLTPPKLWIASLQTVDSSQIVNCLLTNCWLLPNCELPPYKLLTPP